MGPSAIRYSGLSERLESMGIKVRDHGDARAEIPELASERDERARYLPAILGSCAQIAKDVSNMAQSGAMPLVLGGDHSIAMGSLAGLHSVHGPGGLLWIDAHGDLNTPDTSPSGNVHGMPLAAALGACDFMVDGFVPASLDLDVCDPEIAPGVGTPVRGGLSFREAHLAMELLAEAGVITSMEVVEVNPILDNENQTGDLAVELVASALGASIL